MLAGGSISKVVLPHRGWQEDSFVCHMDSSVGLLEHPQDKVAGFLRVSNLGENKAEATMPFRIQPWKSHSIISTMFFWLWRG